LGKKKTGGNGKRRKMKLYRKKSEALNVDFPVLPVSMRWEVSHGSRMQKIDEIREMGAYIGKGRSSGCNSKDRLPGGIKS
jgi:hypothetical protein